MTERTATEPDGQKPCTVFRERKPARGRGLRLLLALKSFGLMPSTTKGNKAAAAAADCDKLKHANPMTTMQLKSGTLS